MPEAVEEVPFDPEVYDSVEECFSAYCVKRFLVVDKAGEEVLLLSLTAQYVECQNMIAGLHFFAEPKLVGMIRAVGLAELY